MTESSKVKVAIACQGGGAQTAFTAGALAYLLDQSTKQKQDGLPHQFEIVALSGTSGGAVCASLAWWDLVLERIPENLDKPVLVQYDCFDNRLNILKYKMIILVFGRRFMMLNPLHCPDCFSEHVEEYSHYETKSNGSRKLYQCTACQKIFSETKSSFIEGLKKPISFIIHVLKARSEGLGFNATCRTFDISKNTLLNWERRFALLKGPLMIYALLHTFLTQLIEGDEVYTKVGKNDPAEASEGWTIILMDRASRFIWALDCGKKDRDLFLSAIQTLKEIILRTGDVTLVTDGERRYRLLLFEICQELFRSGRRGHPRKVLRRGVKVRIKNKGSQSHRRGRKRPKYQTPCSEHPETPQNVLNSEIHANHVEALNASLRRRNSAYRRKTNTYAKKKSGLQRTLDVFWVVHNFIRKHFTTQQVPAVALGILKEGLSWGQIIGNSNAAHPFYLI